MTATVDHRVATDGWSLAVRSFPPPDAPLGVAVCGHAMMCDQRTLDRPPGGGLASTLAAAGLQTYTFDVRGHGQSGPSVAEGGRYDYEDVIEGDVPAMVRWAAARHPDLPLAVVGHSLVGHAALLWLGQNPTAPVDAVLNFAANLWVRHLEPDPAVWRRKRATTEALAALARATGWISAGSGHLPVRWLGYGTADEPLEYVLDLVRYAREDACLRKRDGAVYLAGLGEVQAPVLAYTGSEDTLLCRRSACARFLARVPDHTLRVVEGADHMSLVVDARFKWVWEEAAAWIKSSFRDAGRPPPS